MMVRFLNTACSRALIDVLELQLRLPFLQHHEDMRQLPQHRDWRAAFDMGTSAMIKAGSRLQPQGFVAEVFIVAFKRLHALHHLVCALTIDRYREKVCPLIGTNIAVAITLDIVQWLRLRRL
jgi:hypothetical protein